MSNDVQHFHWLDYTVFIGFLIISTLVGLFFGWRGRKLTSATNFLTGGGEIHWILISFSMQAAFFSAIFLLSTPGEIYAYGTCYSYVGLAFVIGQPIGTHFFIPIFYKLNIISTYQYFEMRFNKFLRTFGSFMFAIQMLLYLPIVLYVPALALSQVTGLDIMLSIIFCGIVCTLYTCLGGMKATVWNDTFQMIIIFTGLFTIIFMGINRVGGFAEFFNKNLKGGRFVYDDFRFDPTLRATFWTQVVGGTLHSIKNFSSNQTIIQKFFSSRSLKDSYKAMYLSLFNCVLILILVTIMGLLAYAFYQDCDPLTSGRVKKLDQVIPLMVMEILQGYHGLPGLFIATAFSAALSSMSSCLNSLAAIILSDFIDSLTKKTSSIMKDKARVILTRLIVLLCGLYTTIMACFSHFLGESAMQLSYSVSGVTGGPLFALICLGMMCPYVDATGGIVGLIVGSAIGFWISIGAMVYENKAPMLSLETYGCPVNNISFGFNSTTISYYGNFSDYQHQTSGLETVDNHNDNILWIYKLSYIYYGAITFITTIVVAMVVSLFTGRKKVTNSSLIISCLRKDQKIEKEDKLETLFDETTLEKSEFVVINSKEEHD